MSRKKRNAIFWSSAFKNKMSYAIYEERLINIALSMFRWSGLPDTVDERYLEWCLCFNGSAIFFRDDIMGELALSGTLSGQTDVYGYPNERIAEGVNGYHKILSRNNSVIIYNDLMHHNTIHGIKYFASRLWDPDRTVDVNIHHQKTPKLIICSENQRLTMKNYYMKYEGNEPMIAGAKGLDIKNLNVFDTTAPFIADKVSDVRDRIWSEALAYLGVPNSSVQKRERINTDEAKLSAGGTMGGRYSRIKARQQAIKKINAMFGTKITCEYEDFILPTEEGEDLPKYGKAGDNE